MPDNPSVFLPSLQRTMRNGNAEERRAELLKLFQLPASEDDLPRPGEASSADPKDLAAILTKCGLPFDRDVAHGRMHRHPIASTWIVSYSCSPGDIRTSQNVVQSLRQGYREARDLVYRFADAIGLVHAALTDPALRDRYFSACVPIVPEEGQTYEDVARKIYVAVPEWCDLCEKEYSNKPGKSKVCADRCTCDVCVSHRVVRKAFKSPVTAHGWQVLRTAVRRVQRSLPNLAPRAILQNIGVNEAGLCDAIVCLLKTEPVDGASPMLPEELAEQVTSWLLALRAAKKAEKLERQSPKTSTPESRAKDLLARTPAVPDPARTSSFLLAVNTYQKEQAALIESLQIEVRAARSALEELLKREADPQALEDLQEVKDQLEDAQAETARVEQTAAAAQEELRSKMGALLVAINTKVENVRAMRLAEDLNAISEAILTGAVDLNIEFPLNQPA